MTENSILEVRDLFVEFMVRRQTLTAIHGVSFSVEKGKTLGIVGESGCGKSVTANSIMRLLPEKLARIPSGSILFNAGNDVFDIAKLAANGKEMRSLRGRKISMIFQDPISSMNPVHTIGAQILEILQEHEKLPTAQATDRVVSLLSELGIPNARDRLGDYPHQFSGGMLQRVIIAIAMICNPELMIADEPTTALDVTIQAQILELIKRIQRDHGTSVILITHNMGIIVDYAESLAVMYMGRIVERGLTRTVFQNPCHPYTKALLKSVPVPGMNKKERLASIEGNTPDLSALPSGCFFHPRCPDAMEVCSQVVPSEQLIEPSHSLSCHLYRSGGGSDNG